MTDKPRARKAIVFDIDGTLIDTRPSLISAYQLTCAKMRVEPKQEVFLNNLGRSLEDIFLSIHRSQNNFKFASVFRGFARETEASAKPFPGMLELVSQAVGAAEFCAYLTNKDRSRATALLERVGFPTLKVYSPSGEIAPKPRPDLFHQLLAEAEVGKALYFGDSMEDYLASQSAGVDFVLCSWGYGQGSIRSHYTCSNAIQASSVIDIWADNDAPRSRA